MKPGLLDTLGINVAFLVAAFAGAITSLYWLKPMGRGQLALVLFIGLSFGLYMTPLIAAHLGFTDDHSKIALAYAMGALALTVIPLGRNLVIAWLESKKPGESNP